MQARLQLIRFPTLFFAIAFALAAALSLGAVLGYTLKPATIVSGPARTVYVTTGGPQSDLTRALPTAPTATYDPNANACVWVNHTKAC